MTIIFISFNQYKQDVCWMWRGPQIKMGQMCYNGNKIDKKINFGKYYLPEFDFLISLNLLSFIKLLLLFLFLFFIMVLCLLTFFMLALQSSLVSFLQLWALTQLLLNLLISWTFLKSSAVSIYLFMPNQKIQNLFQS